MSKLKDKLKNKTESNASNKDGGGGGFTPWFTLPEGMEMYILQEGKKKNLIDILPYIVKTKNNPDTVKGDPDYVLNLWIHKNIGIKKQGIVCPKQYNKPCPICEEVERLKDDATGNKDLINDIKGKKRGLYNIIDLKDGNKHKLFEISTNNKNGFEKKVLLAAEDSDDGTVIFADPEEGMSVRIRGILDSYNGNEFISLDSVDLEEREEQYEEDIINEMISLDTLVNVLSYEQIEKIFFQAPGDDDEDEQEGDSPEEEEEETPKRKSKKSIQKSGTGRKNRPVDDGPRPEQEDEEDEEEVKPKKKKEKGKKSKCPHGHTFGDDCDEFADCDDCDLWDECSDE